MADTNPASPSGATSYETLTSGKAKPTDLALPVDTLTATKNPCTLSWKNLSYTVETKKTERCPTGKKTILSNVSGRCAPGELTAVMGPSGCGKTTLLDILADRISSGTIEGNISLNGEARNAKTFRAVSSYVAQEDSLLGSFTVLETLEMAARLSLPNAVTHHEIVERVQTVIDEMGLRVCEHTLIGDIFRKGISGGQKRRVSIAIELLSEPSVLLLDEPTSGLDSASTYNVMQFVSKLCKENKTVICTIHQPSSLVYEMFTNVVILTAGETVYFGPREQILDHFTASGYSCPMYMNPAEYFISLVNSDFEGHADIKKLVNSFSSSSIAQSIVQKIDEDAAGVHNAAPVIPVKPSALRQFVVLMQRNSLNNVRNPGIYWVRLAMYTMLSFMVGTMYLSTNDDISEEDMIPLLFYVQAFLVFMSVAVLPFFIEQRAVFMRERANSGLNVFSYVVANFIATLPGIFLIAAVSTFLVVLLSGLHGFWYFLLNLFLALVVAESLMHVIGAAVPHYIIGIALGAGIYGMFMLCEGFMVPKSTIPDYWIWAYYLAFHSYSFKSFVFEHFNQVDTPTAKAILQRLDMEDVDTPQNMIILACYAIGLELIFTFILYKFHTGRR
ncbi:ABC transporter-like protein [Phytophthora sojae]|uniref:ABC transporter-like protein n=1 Tax=Phytophthora sojae (strain P6497) TaxID=1094619 RepID=G4Z7Q9_PHYSP|nr:ABC transporter-like protein [Phytophthora sojae]EGZ21813.1 ABC transporter-like protein [Phytophthora sojae]|eukprot:XP_009524530.1 ABC transporter-like protein [Phytophthora sojae]